MSILRDLVTTRSIFSISTRHIRWIPIAEFECPQNDASCIDVAVLDQNRGLQSDHEDDGYDDARCYYFVSASAAEYCQLEMFEASCPDGSVILMQNAKYGRMKLGRCLTRDYFVGCDADVLPQLDQRCSGRRHCYMNIPDHSLLRALSCPQDLVSYLEVEYSCVKGEFSKGESLCSSRLALIIYIAPLDRTKYQLKISMKTAERSLS